MVHRNPARVAAPRAKRPCLVRSCFWCWQATVLQSMGPLAPAPADPAWRMLANKNRVRCQEALIGYERSCGSVGTER